MAEGGYEMQKTLKDLEDFLQLGSRVEWDAATKAIKGYSEQTLGLNHWKQRFEEQVNINQELEKNLNNLSARSENDTQMQPTERRSFESRTEYDRMIKSLEENNQKLEDERKAIQYEYDSFKAAQITFQKEISVMLDENPKLKKENELLKKHLRKLQDDKEDVHTHNVNTTKEIETLKEELRDTKSRLSKLISTQVTDNNPDIVDLSDSNRPNKLAERYQELYDNQWSDAYEAVDRYYFKASETQKVRFLLEILYEARQFCVKADKDQEALLKEALFTEKCHKSLPDAIRKPLKDMRKAMIPSNAELLLDPFEKYLKNTRNSDVGEQWVLQAIRPFIKECLTVGWIMVLNDPPIEFGPDVKQLERFDTNLYKTYTQKGDRIDYVVWPPLLMSGSGALITKGTAQAYVSSSARVKTAPTSHGSHAAYVVPTAHTTTRGYRPIIHGLSDEDLAQSTLSTPLTNTWTGNPENITQEYYKSSDLYDPQSYSQRTVVTKQTASGGRTSGGSRRSRDFKYSS